MTLKQTYNDTLTNVRDGNITFEQYINLRTAITDFAKTNDIFILYQNVFKILLPNHKIDHKEKENINFVNNLLNELNKWAERENKTLTSQTLPQEEQAGIKTFSENVGWLGILIPIAKDFKTNPDEVLQWKYNTIYSILFYESQKNKYEQKLNNVYKHLK